MDARELTELTEHLRGGGLAEQLRDYHRTSVLVVTEAQHELLRLRITTGGGELDISAAADLPSTADALVVRINMRTAYAIGVGTSLLEDEFAAGTIGLDGAQPDDYRQAPVLESLLEGLAGVGALSKAGTSA